MLSSLHGKLESLGSDWAIINVHGIGFQVYLPTPTLSTLGARGGEVHLHTHLHLREDSATLYGFSTTDDRELFQLILNVSGIGPKIALTILSTISVEQVNLAIANGNVDILMTVPGIGNKTASRLLLELKDKIGTDLVATPLTRVVQESIDVVATLTSLGYSAAEATRAVATLPNKKKLNLEEKIKLALQYFSQKK
ncbi:MAG TPA: Holliday junction branch migration protein RuvA [Dehalococcoidales bacterium]|nr:Holliday junction branch migration protein RuvA [Dehalococcoidales bacterium]HJM36596.1 Holliday junction branch migration protein RuvA [Dehalococcoidales bacterium]